MPCTTQSLGAVLALLGLLATAPAHADTVLGPGRLSGEVALGARVGWGDEEAAKFEEYRDLHDGVVGGYRLRFEDDDSRWFVRGIGENVGYDDQRHRLEAGRFGAFELALFYRALPHVLSRDALTLYRREGESYRLPPGVQAGIASQPTAAARSTRLAAELRAARGKDLELGWRESGGELELRFGSRRLYASYKAIDRHGTRAQTIDWGSPGDWFVAFPSELDDRIHELRSGLELVLGEYDVSLDYLGSFYENEQRAALVDNPLVANDAAGASSTGRLALAPDNAAHRVALTAAGRLPFAFPARGVATLAWGLQTQDQRFLPHTSNPLIANDPRLVLPQRDLDGRVQTWLANVLVDLEPVPGWDLDLRYRLYSRDDQSDEIDFEAEAINDAPIVEDERRSVANDYTRQKLSLELGHGLARALRGRLGFELEHWHRSGDRQVEGLLELGPRLALDWRPSITTSLHASWAYLTRDGDGYDPYAHFDESLGEDGRDAARRFGEFAELRKYDQADRDLHQLRLQAHSLRGERLELSLSAGADFADYRTTDYGLREQASWNLGGELFYRLHARLGVGLHYDFEAQRWEQDSRWRPRSFFVPPPGQIVAVDDAQNDWSSRTRSRYHTTGLRLEAELLRERLDLELGWTGHFGRERATNSAVPGAAPASPPTTSGDGGNTEHFPEIRERLHAFDAALHFRLSERVTLSAEYRFEDYDLDGDPRRLVLGPTLAESNVNGDGTVSPSLDTWLADEVGDYQAHVARLLARFRF